MQLVTAPDIWHVELADWPGSTITCFECRWPEAEDGGADVILPAVCETHQRSVYWCLNAGVFWCDGGPPMWCYHRWPP